MLIYTYVLPVNSPNALSLYTPYKLDINHLQLHKHCPCRTVVARTPQAIGGRGKPSDWGGVVIPAMCVCVSVWFCVYVCMYVCMFVCLYVCPSLSLSVSVSVCVLHVKCTFWPRVRLHMLFCAIHYMYKYVSINMFIYNPWSCHWSIPLDTDTPFPLMLKTPKTKAGRPSSLAGRE